MRFILTLVFIFVLGVFGGCSERVVPESSLEMGASLIENNNLEQDQKKYSIIKLSGGQEFPSDCDWETLERVVDGDTIVVKEDQRVRLIGIDTPESKHPKKKVQPHALESTKALIDLLGEGEVRLCLITSRVGDVYDYYGRKLAYLFTESGLDINAEMLKTGNARGYFKFPFDRKEDFQNFEKESREKKLGIWAL